VPPDTESGNFFSTAQMGRFFFRLFLKCPFDGGLYFKICGVPFCSFKRRTVKSKNEPLNLFRNLNFPDFNFQPFQNRAVYPAVSRLGIYVPLEKGVTGARGNTGPICST
jgi:hypothetical protein